MWWCQWRCRWLLVNLFILITIIILNHRWNAACIIQKQFRKSYLKTQHVINNHHIIDDSKHNIDNDNQEDEKNESNNTRSIIGNNTIIVQDTNNNVINKNEISSNRDTQFILKQQRLLHNYSINSCSVVIDFLLCVRRYVLRTAMLNYIRLVVFLLWYSYDIQ